MAELGHNITGLKKEIADALGKLKQLKNDRADANEEMGAIRAALEAKGIPKKALAMAISYINLDPDDRENFDVAYAIVREAAGLPLQEDLFQAADRMAAENAGKPEGDGKKEPDAAGMAKVIASQDDPAKGKKVLPSSTGAGTIN